MSRKRLNLDPGSFRDPAGQVYILETGPKKRILRGINEVQLENHRRLFEQDFFTNLQSENKIINTWEVNEPETSQLLGDNWSGIIEHEPIPYISYPYEWSFEMLRDAALLQLEIMDEAIAADWTMKDATPYNIQWLPTGPVFIDTPSFEPWVPGSMWQGYRQFCSMFLVPLLIHSHLKIDHRGILRAHLDGLPPIDAAKYFQGKNKFKRGVLPHIIFPARVEKSLLKKQGERRSTDQRSSTHQSKTMIRGLVDSLARLIGALKPPSDQTEWGDYAHSHSYDLNEEQNKKQYVEKQVDIIQPKFVWDLGCNSGEYSQIAAKNGASVLALDGDHGAIEHLYQEKKNDAVNTILPLVMNLANPSPSQGWNGKERLSIEARGTPDMVICLALIHHIRLSAHIPISAFLDWLYSLSASIVLEFVGRDDEMVQTLLARKQEQYLDYDEEHFDAEIEKRFVIKEQTMLKSGTRKILTLVNK